MEEALKIFEQEEQKLPPLGNTSDAIASALQALQLALQNALPILLDSRSNESGQNKSGSGASTDISAAWLLEQCQKIPSELEPIHLARAIVAAAHETDPAQQQSILFDALGFSEEAMTLQFELAPLLPTIRTSIRELDLEHASSGHLTPANGTISDATYVDIDEERRQHLVREAMDAAELAAIAQAEVDELLGTGGNGSINVATHTITRTSEVKAQKFAQKAAKRASQARQRAIDAGALLDDSTLLKVDEAATIGEGGLMKSTNNDLWTLQQSLLPEGSREHYDKHGLPSNAIREEEGDMVRVTIPAVRLDKDQLADRLVITDVMDPPLSKAFEGTKSLNPMQSTTFDVAFHTRDNMMVCAPTGAGKTNVAMLTVASHFRDVGLLGGDGDSMDTGTKVVYIAPMKALAQEVVEKFSEKLKPLRLIVRELTGDMQLTRAEAGSANVIVTTPEKWDVVTRKSGTDENSLGNQCGLLIIDEVHLLADERGAVIESVVSRLHRLVESRQRQVRIIALSATLPNYHDVAKFLQVPERGIFYFGPEHRPVPLQQKFIGVSVNPKDRRRKEERMNQICFDVVLDSLQRGHQVMVFVHSRKGTGETASALADLAVQEDVLERSFLTQGKEGDRGKAYLRYADKAKKSRNREVSSHFQNGMGIHHAGMLRGDRKLTEQMFHDGAIKVLCCTATLAWGINLPAHSVVVKGTEVYNPEKGGTVDLSILDVQQIFGRAGRPQFQDEGEATLITTNEAFPRYMDKLVRPIPIESNFIKQLADHLNAEVVGGTVSNIREAAQWLTYTYLYVRMLGNPLAYGINADQKADDPMLHSRCLELVKEAAKLLDYNKMLRYDVQSGNLGVADSGRVAAHFYIQAESIATFNDMMHSGGKIPTDSDLCRVICSANEFKQMKLRPDEMDELQKIGGEFCPFQLKGAGGDGVGRTLITDPVDKAFILLQAYISRAKIKSFTLISDMNYIASNAGRVTRAIFEICLKLNKASESTKLLRIAKSVDNRCWWFKTPLRHFENELKEVIYSSLELNRNKKGYDTFEDALSLLEMQPVEVGQLCRCSRNEAEKVQRFVGMLPIVLISCKVKPILNSVVNFHLVLTSNFEWHGRWHGGAQNFWVWVEDHDTNKIHHHEHVTLSKRTFSEPKVLDFSLPLFDSYEDQQYYVRVISDGWVGIETGLPISLRNIELPTGSTPHTNLLDLAPLPTTALMNPKYEQLYTKFKKFNPIQTQLFHVLYHTDTPVLLGAPTGSGKTAVAELAILRMKTIHPAGVCVYIAPLKALARERLKEWQHRLGAAPLRWNVLELSGDTHHDRNVLERADILVCTPEKWDLISRGWRAAASMKLDEKTTGTFISRVKLLCIDEIHLLGEDRGAVLEAIVSRTRFIARHVEQQKRKATIEGQENKETPSESTRIIGLSTTLANPVDLADWIGIETKGYGPTANRGMYNFRPSVRPVPTKIHIQGYPGKHYCPRMATMNKPCFAAIKELSPTKPSLIFVASRRQTRLTAFDIISYAASDENPKMFLGCSDARAESAAEGLRDESLRHTITFGIGLHHAGLSSSDRDVVENMFLSGEIRVLVATATLAWGVNLPAHLVIVKGTEYFDGKTSRYVDYPLTDVMQMVGRAGRPGFDTEAKAVVMVAQEKKVFYKRFLYTPFPVESCLEQRINETLNAEIASGSLETLVDGVGYLTWTFFARRVKGNPMYYNAESSSDDHVESRLLAVVQESFERLHKGGCIEFSGDGIVKATTLGKSSAQFYLQYLTPKQMQIGIREVRRTLNQSATKHKNNDMIPMAGFQGLHQFQRPVEVDELSIAWLLFTLCSTHEFDELPVRHNEEFLNEELSEQLMWGPDTADIGSETSAYRNAEIFADPHTKAFLLMQAYLESAKLPISDYINDTKSVVDNVPRLLSAMAFIASGDSDTAGSFEVMTQFSRTRQVIESRCRIDHHPILQLPGVNPEAIRRISQGKNTSCKTLLDLRASKRKDAVLWLKDVLNGKKGRHGSMDACVDALYAFPFCRLVEASVYQQSDKATGKSMGKLKITIEVDQNKGRASKSDRESSTTLTLLLGSLNQRFLLAQESVRLSRFGSWTVQRELIFDWPTAYADGGTIVLRLLIEEIRGLDSEVFLALK